MIHNRLIVVAIPAVNLQATTSSQESTSEEQEKSFHSQKKDTTLFYTSCCISDYKHNDHLQKKHLIFIINERNPTELYIYETDILSVVYSRFVM